MPKFSIASEVQLASCDKRLQAIAREAIKYYDFSVVEGHRGKLAQEAAFAKGASKLHWPHGNHNATPSRAYDLAPWPVDWSEGQLPHARFAILAGVILVCAVQLGTRIRWGVDWNRNWDPRDETFLDWGHFELDEP
jgi:peptidoglycan L-alanyl-D-glutamate endopeptidase CwlK